MSDLGVRREMHAVIYDQHGLSMGASRAWWLFHLWLFLGFGVVDVWA